MTRLDRSNALLALGSRSTVLAAAACWPPADAGPALPSDTIARVNGVPIGATTVALDAALDRRTRRTQLPARARPVDRQGCSCSAGWSSACRGWTRARHDLQPP